MTDSDKNASDLEAALLRSRSTDGMTRNRAITELAEYIQDERAVARLHEMLDDEVVTMQVDAADVLARQGGIGGLFLVLDEIGRRREDPDADYMANRLYELDASGEVEILATVEPISSQLSENGIIGFRQLKTLRGQG
ncbi:hypothetical protein [Nocardia flavorosea]|uniref:Uncharacterized protein n=1 Tax=Nocardia flavorosea TaxID=53429 RepID=A0A846YGI6_9NOCA|nr:hypothetical protein [Nocardia flavorosea]NKY55959.1 hypothetical protein [Nocardia flavorosea]